jgi:P4 family phage/plasmid primase-like protien
MSASLKTQNVMPPPDAPLADWRLAYAWLGWHTFLVHGIKDGRCTCGKRDCRAPGKHPVFPGQDRGATLDKVRIRAEGLKYPHANIAVHLGLSRLVCVDVDPRNGGNETLARLEREHGRLDAGIIAETGGGGTHHFFRVPADGQKLRAKDALGHGIDLLQNNQYPVIAPSKHRSGQVYRWVSECDPWEGKWLLSTPPAWMLKGESLEPVVEVASEPDDDDWVTDLPTSRPFDWTPDNLARLRSALAATPADDRETWLRIGAALHHASECGGEGRDLWDEWSFGSDAFDGCPGKFTLEGQKIAWDGFDPQRSDAVTVGTIFHEAKQHGWQDPRQAAEPDTLGDISNGRRFAARYREEFLYVSRIRKWLRWDGLRWATCDKGEQFQAAKALADSILREAGEAFTHDPNDAKRRRHGLALAVHRSLPRLDAMLEAASTEPGMSMASPTAFDANPWLLGVRNGVLDLKAGKLLPANPVQHISKQAGASFHPGAACPRWEVFLREVFGDGEVVTFVQRLAGYTLTGLVDEEVLAFMFGAGANGKSVFANVLVALLSEYAVTVGTELLARNKSESETARYKTKLQGARLALANEVGQADTWDDQRVKEITSREAIPARYLYGEAFSFIPTHKLWVRGNHQPTIQDASDGMWRRLILIPFNRRFTPEERIPDLDRQLIEGELEGILAWAVRGCREWQKGGLAIPASISMATGQYRSESDVIEQWRAERCVTEIGARLDVREAYDSWVVFCHDTGISSGSQPKFTRRLKAAGVRHAKSNGKGYFLDVSIPTLAEDCL